MCWALTSLSSPEYSEQETLTVTQLFIALIIIIIMKRYDVERGHIEGTWRE